ncbi:MAG: NAD(P)/FAD-dependent oxidoreductase [Rhizobiaceae bacterium]
MTESNGRRQRIAVIGSGISGLSAAWLLHKSADVTVYERSRRIGGHTHTVDVAAGASHTPVDMGFIVYNEQTYPNLTALFAKLDVATETTDMSLAVALDDGRLEYAGGHLNQLFAQKRNLVSPRFWRMLLDLARFYRTAPDDLNSLVSNGMTLGTYLKENQYSDAFRDDHLLPMAAAIWSMPTSDVLDYPAHAFIQFHDNHGLLKLTSRPLWRTVTGGSRSYVEKLTSPFKDSIRKGAAIESVERRSDGIVLRTSTGQSEQFDQVVIAAHADQTLGMLADPTSEERRLLGAFRYNTNQAVLHGDDRLMPKRRRAWASWNYIGGRQQGAHADLTVTYWMNSLQPLPNDKPLFVTLNPNREIDRDKVYHTQEFEHPIVDGAATDAQKQLWSLQGRQGVWYCGAYFGAGFHEDGLQSGVAVAEAISGHKRPWRVTNESGRIHVGLTPQMSSLEGIAA